MLCKKTPLKGAFLFGDFFCCVWECFLAFVVSLVSSVELEKRCVCVFTFLCGRGFSIVPSVELKKLGYTTLLPSDDMGYRTHTWQLTHSQVICLVPLCPGPEYESHVITLGKKNKK